MTYQNCFWRGLKCVLSYLGATHFYIIYYLTWEQGLNSELVSLCRVTECETYLPGSKCWCSVNHLCYNLAACCWVSTMAEGLNIPNLRFRCRILFVTGNITIGIWLLILELYKHFVPCDHLTTQFLCKNWFELIGDVPQKCTWINSALFKHSKSHFVL